MARLKKAILGKISGAVGDILFRIRRNRNYVGTRPTSFIPGIDVNSVNRRKRFKITVKFSSAVNKISSLRTLWKKNFPDSFMAINSIFKVNYFNATPDNLTDSASLVPDIGFEIPGSDVTFTTDVITVNLNPIGTGTNIDTNVETQFFLSAVIYLSDKLDENYKDYLFLSVSFPKIPLNLVNPLDFSYSLSDIETQLLARYSTKKTYLALISLTDLDEPIHFSNTFLSS